MVGGHGSEEPVNAAEGVDFIVMKLSSGEISKAELCDVGEEVIEMGSTRVMLKGQSFGAGVEPSFRGVNKIPVTSQERGMIRIRGSSSSELVKEKTHGRGGGGEDMGTNNREGFTVRAGKGETKDPPGSNRVGGDAHSKAVPPSGANKKDNSSCSVGEKGSKGTKAREELSQLVKALHLTSCLL